MTWLTNRYRHAVRWAIEHRCVTVGLAGLVLFVAGFLGFSGVIGSEFLPHLDEGAIWVRGTLAPVDRSHRERAHHERGSAHALRLS